MHKTGMIVYPVVHHRKPHDRFPLCFLNLVIIVNSVVFLDHHIDTMSKFEHDKIRLSDGQYLKTNSMQEKLISAKSYIFYSYNICHFSMTRMISIYSWYAKNIMNKKIKRKNKNRELLSDCFVIRVLRGSIGIAL